MATTAVGAAVGSAIADPERFGLDFVLTAIFIILAIGLWRGREDIAPWALAAVVAVAGVEFLPGNWYILLGGIAGSLAAVIRHD